MKVALGLILLLQVAATACVAQLPVVSRGSFVYFETGVPMEKSKHVSAAAIAAIKVFYKKVPARPFAEAGIVEAVVVSRGESAALKHIFAELKKQAATMGMDAIYKIELQRYNHSGDAMHATAVAIRFTR